MELVQNMSYALQCNLMTGSKPVFFDWLKNGHKLPLSNKVKIENFETFSLLTMKDLQASDSSNFTCNVHNSFGSDSTSTHLIVKGLMF